MRILLLGANGQLGFELAGALGCFAEVVARTRAEADLAQNDPDLARRLVADARPEVIVNASAYTDVDGAEREPEIARRVNSGFVRQLGVEAIRTGAALVHFSTDFVFDGEKGSPYVETDLPHPLGEYARSKFEGEQALVEMEAPALIFRTAWVYSVRRKSFVSTILRLARERETMQVVTDQIGSPTFCRDLATAVGLVLYGMRAGVVDAIRSSRGIYHLAGEGQVSRFDFAEAIVALDPKKQEHKVRTIVPIGTADFPLPAKRPLATPLHTGKALETWGVALPDWQSALSRALASG